MAAVALPQSLDPTSTRPAAGILAAPPRLSALVDARVVIAPGNQLPRASVLIEDQRIVAVGAEIDLPPGTEVIEASGQTIYAGLIDAAAGSSGGVQVASAASAEHWNRYVRPQDAPRIEVGGDEPLSGAAALRKQGVTVRLVAPQGGIFSGTSHAVLAGGPADLSPLLAADVAQHLRLTLPVGASGRAFPRSPMGAVALVRQTLSDARWFADALAAHQADRRIAAPEADPVLQTIHEAMRHGRLIIDCPNERFVARADALAREFSLDVILKVSSRQYQLIESAVEAARPMLVPVAVPSRPDVSTVAAADEVSLGELMHWHLAPENPARLADAGLRIALISDGLEEPSQLLGSIRRVVARGLDAETALAGLTTVPAGLLGIDQRVGTIAAGKLANLVVTDGDLFDESTEVLETWIAGRRYRHQPPLDGSLAEELAGNWQLLFRPAVGSRRRLDLRLQLDDNTEKLSGRFSSGEDDEQAVELDGLRLEHDRLTAHFDTESLEPTLPAGVAQLALTIAPRSRAAAALRQDRPRRGAALQAADISGQLLWPDGRRSRLSLRRGADEPPSDDDAEAKRRPSSHAVTEAGEAAGEQEPKAAAEAADLQLALVRPLGAAGVRALPPQPEAVLFRGATVWTCGPQGKLSRGDVLVRSGKITAIAERIQPPEDCQVVDGHGMHLTPGIIDCHSHIATDGGVNEASRAVTADVRIGDFIDHTDITIYRQLAGGVTTANILHGSANPIGGQNQLIKMRWGADPDGLRFVDAPPGIKFALGENVKRDSWREGASLRYPQTRMGVEQLLRDRFLAAREYDARWRRWRSQRRGLPPRRDLRLEALAEVLRGQRWVHCHSYRQDEIAALLAVLAEFNVQIGTLQHILEGYKVAEVLAEHRAMASTFADWWAYKFEVYDAIPFNAAVMARRGIVVSMNSDDRELGRHLNIEAAKAVRYGDVEPIEALKMVTINPARQLRIEDRVGSIEPGKDADLVLWTAPPLSTFARCEQTWIDGRQYFWRQQDAQRQAEQQQLKATLIQAVLADQSGGKATSQDDSDDEPGDASQDDADDPERPWGARRIAEEDRWDREDIYCAARFGHRAALQRDGRNRATDTNQ